MWKGITKIAGLCFNFFFKKWKCVDQIIILFCCCPVKSPSPPSAPRLVKLANIMHIRSHFPLRVESSKRQIFSSPLEGGVILRTVCVCNDRKKVHCKKSENYLSLTFSFLAEAIHNVRSCVSTVCVHSCVSVSVLCWPSWACTSSEHLLLSVSGHCDLLPQSCGLAWVQNLGDPVGCCTNSGALPRRFRPPQNLPIAGAQWQPDDGHSAEFPTQSSSGKFSTQHWAGQHTGSEPEENRNSVCPV